MSIRPRIARSLLMILALACSGAPAGESGPSSGSRFVTQGAVVYDQKTDRSWQRCSYGQTWDEKSGCTGEPRRVSFDEAQLLATDGWRLPTLDELSSLVVKGAVPAIDTTAFPNTPPLYFWATDNRDKSASWYVYFENGRVNHYFPPRTNRDLLRLVRSGKWTPKAARP